MQAPHRFRTLESPEQIRQSRSDSDVFHFYGAEKSSRWVCAVAKRAADQGFLITAYPTDAIKEGTQVWPKPSLFPALAPVMGLRALLHAIRRGGGHAAPRGVSAPSAVRGGGT